MNAFSQLLDRFPRKPELYAWAAFAVSGAVLLTVHLLEWIGNMVPCPLCLEQRKVYWAAMALSILAVALMRFGEKWRPWHVRAGLGLLAACFLAGVWVSFYHIGVEQHWWVSSCAGNGGQSIADMLAGDPNQKLARCDEAATLFGISLATYNFLLSIGLALLVSLPLWRPLVKGKQA